MTDQANPSGLQLLSLTLAYDDTRFFGAILFTHPDHPEEKDEAVLIDHTDEPPWFRLTNVNPDARDPAAAEMVEADRIMRFLLRYTPDRIGRTRADFPRP